MPSDCAQKEYTVYRHTNMTNGKVYIGITSTDITRRSGSNGKNGLPELAVGRARFE